MRGSRGGPGGPDPLPLENHKLYGFLAILVQIPWKISKSYQASIQCRAIIGTPATPLTKLSGYAHVTGLKHRIPLYGFLAILIPWKITKLPSQYSMSGHHRHASEMPFNGVSLVSQFSGIMDRSSLHQRTKKKLVRVGFPLSKLSGYAHVTGLKHKIPDIMRAAINTELNKPTLECSLVCVCVCVCVGEMGGG